MLIRGNLVDIHAKRIYPAEVLVEDGMIRRVEETGGYASKYLLPGFIDSHVHIESSMLTPGEFARIAVSHGTVGVVSDPHEIANVMGLEGIDFMMADGTKVPFYFWFGAPSCVPATELESSGARLGPDDIGMLLERKEIKYLSEMMNFPGVLNSDAEVKQKLDLARKAGKPVDGHAPGLTGRELEKYILSGISTDHESSTLAEAREKIALGMKILIREGSAARNLDSLKDLYISSPEMLMLCSDDIHPEMLAKRHINKLVAKLIREGYNIFDVIRSCTVNPVLHYGLEAGLLRSGDPADFIVVDDPEQMNVIETWIKGKQVFSDGETRFKYSPARKINRFNSSQISPDQIRIMRAGNRIRIIKAFDGDLFTESTDAEILPADHIEPDRVRDILKIVVKDRYNDSPPATAFITGIGLKKGAFAGSVAHDSHNIISIGTNDSDICTAINEIVRLKGGLCFADGERTESLKLDIAGIMTDRPCRDVAAEYERLTELVRSAGSSLAAPFMTMSFMALLVIPELKISDRGLFDGREFRFVPLFVD